MNFTVPRPSILVVNYPSNPTAETVDLAFLRAARSPGRASKVWIISDLAYSELYFDGNPTVSILQVKGAKDVAIEFTSLSQDLFDGRLADRLRGGQPRADRGDDAREILSRLRRLHADPEPRPAPRSNGPQDIVEKNRQLYHKRRDVLVESFGRAG